MFIKNTMLPVTDYYLAVLKQVSRPKKLIVTSLGAEEVGVISFLFGFLTPQDTEIPYPPANDIPIQHTKNQARRRGVL